MDRASPAALADAAVQTGCQSVAFTYNDPVIFAEYAIDVSAACRERGVHPVAVTAGYITDLARAEFFAAMDAVNVDLKAFDQRFYRRLCSADIEPVKETLRHLVHDTNVWVEITTLIIPEENDSEHEIRSLSAWIRETLRPDVPLHFSAYHPDYKLKRPATPMGTLTRARAIALEEGLQFVYTGNVHDSKGGSTWCPQCGSLLIERDWYEIGRWGLTSDPVGHCHECNAHIPGQFESVPGRWGRSRQRIQIPSGEPNT